ncbi:site-specific integrase [Geobacter sulfurreducens subsp. ethanolicus]|uniref:tyrosine-type recombinase/integrase n=1 Tax=Geobacter sulfurreducens TaxID=35554 RepID=UPI002573B064|nr:site-specific integrase [Geobacter sulfurreducens]BEH09860.1 site-specific integrase [Geobacter sulfurreducens subsp. ethanolicus]
MSRAKIVFTDTMIKKLKPEATEYRKSEGNGFTIRVMPSGFKSWLYLYAIDGKRRCMNLGHYPEVTLETARDKFEAARKLVKNGLDPLEAAEQTKEERRKAPTVAELFADYMKRHAKLNKRESSWREDERLFKVNVEPTWGKRKAADIKKRDCITLLDSYADRPALCHNVMKLTRKLFNFAVEKDILEHTPFTGVKVPVELASRERILSETEIRNLWITELPKAAMSDEVKRIIKLLLLTGQRVGEVCGINVDEIDGHWWTLPPERTKNRQIHTVYLTDTAIELLGTPVNGYYFPSPVTKSDSEGNPIYTHIDENAVAYAIRRNLKNYQPRRPIKSAKISMVEVPEEKKMELAHFTPHDLRRTFSTGLAKLGFHDEVIDAVTGHKKQGIIKIYNRHKYDAEKKQALEAWERRIFKLTNK